MFLPVWGATDCLRSDNGSEFVARQVKKWLLWSMGLAPTILIQKALQNPFIESFNSKFRMTFLNRWCVFTLAGRKLSLAVAGGLHRNPFTQIAQRLIATSISTEFP